jgi:hypothetical protein
MGDVSQIVEFKRVTAGASSDPGSGGSPMQVRPSALLAFLPAIKLNNPTIVIPTPIPILIDGGGPNSIFSSIINGGVLPNTLISRIINGGIL